MPQTSYITKIPRRHPTRNNTFTIHASIRSHLSSNISTRQHRLEPNLSTIQNRYKKPSVTTDSNNIVQVSRRRRSITLSQLNYWDNYNSNGCFESTQQMMHFEADKLSNQTGSTNERPTILDETKKKKFSKKKFPWFCSMPCILVCLLIGLLLASAIIGSVIGILFGSKTTTTTTSTILTTTIVTPTVCSCLCPNESWVFDSGYLARWSFDETLNDINNIYNATAYNNPSFVTNGYVNQALFFNASLIQSLSTPYIPLAYTSFTVEVWLKPTLFPNLIDHSILGLCPSAAPNQCLHLLIREINSNYYLYFGFFADDCHGNTSLTLNQWIHAAFVFDITTLTQSIYLNGILDNSCTASSPIIASTGSVTIGVIPAIIPINNMNFFQGYIDHLTITKRAKSSCEILEDATLAACFLFNAAAPYTDSGSNSLLSSQLSTSIISSGPSNEAISFNGTAYFQASSFTALGFGNKPFSIILWLQPQSVFGPIVHVSSMSNGQGWCFPFLGIAANGSVIAQIYNAGSVAIWGPSISMAPVWSHIVQTWSPTNGLRLYINNVLVAFQTSAITYAASGVSDFVTLSNGLNGYNYCAGGALGSHTPGPLKSDIDDFRLYSRELTASDVSTIYYSR